MMSWRAERIAPDQVVSEYTVPGVSFNGVKARSGPLLLQGEFLCEFQVGQKSYNIVSLSSEDRLLCRWLIPKTWRRDTWEG